MTDERETHSTTETRHSRTKHHKSEHTILNTDNLIDSSKGHMFFIPALKNNIIINLETFINWFTIIENTSQNC